MERHNRINYLVLAILTEWKIQSRNLPIIKLKDEQIRKALRKMPESVREQFEPHIKEILQTESCVNEFGQWHFIEHDSFSWLLVHADCMKETIVWPEAVFIATLRTKLPLDEICVMLHVETEIL